MRTQPVLEIADEPQDPRIVRSPGQTLEEMLLEQERETLWLLESAAGTCVSQNVRDALQRVLTKK